VPKNTNSIQFHFSSGGFDGDSDGGLVGGLGGVPVGGLGGIPGCPGGVGGTSPLNPQKAHTLASGELTFLQLGHRFGF
jgi:hypothetical protein